MNRSCSESLILTSVAQLYNDISVEMKIMNFLLAGRMVRKRPVNLRPSYDIRPKTIFEKDASKALVNFHQSAGKYVECFLLIDMPTKILDTRAKGSCSG